MMMFYHEFSIEPRFLLQNMLGKGLCRAISSLQSRVWFMFCKENGRISNTS